MSTSDQMARSPSSDDSVNVHLSDAGRFSYAALVALTFHHHFADEEDRSFRQSYMQKLVVCLGLQKSQPFMEMLMETGGQETDAYLNLLMNEPSLQGDGTLLITESLTFWIQDGVYDARIRVIIQDLATLLKLSSNHFDMLETSIGEMILHEAKKIGELEEERRGRKGLKQAIKKYTLIGAASISGGVLLGLSGGLTAPLFGVGLAALFGTSAVATTTVGGTAVLASLFGAAGAGITGYKMNKRVGDVEEFQFIPLTSGEGSRLHFTIAVPGWLPPLNDKNEETEEKICQHFMTPYKCLVHSQEQYGLLYETKYMMALGSAINMVYDMVVSTVATEALKLTVLQGLIAAVALPQSMLSLISVIDNPWGVCCSRAVKVGEQLANNLMDRKFGHRPVTLVGFSLGARVIYYCLRELQRRGAEKGIVQDAVLIGAPVTGEVTKWRPLLQVVAGRLVNAYSRNDWLLKYLYRVTSVANHVAGLEPIDIQHRRMINIDLSEVIGGHGEYLIKANDCLNATLLRTREMEEPSSSPPSSSPTESLS